MKTTIRLSIILLAALSYLTVFVSCNKEDNEPEPEPLVLDCNSFSRSYPDKITKLEDRGLPIDYIIDCTISVDIDLTIDPGVTIAFTNGAGMLITEDGSLNASGTPDKQITFTGTNKVKGSWKGIISIVKDSRLTIQPGVTIEFESGTGIIIGDSDQSTLIAVGTPANPITFTGVTKVAGAWENIDFHFTKSPLNEISHPIIEYGGSPGSDGVVYMWAKPIVKVTNVIFREIGSCAIYAAPSASNPNENLSDVNNTISNVAGGYICGD